ncbi:GNAT family N-acetyltransferase [soil metagenome]
MTVQVAHPAGEGVTLRDVTEDDVAIFFRHQLDPEATGMAAFPARDREAHKAHWDKILGAESVVTKTIVDGGVAGNVVSWVQDGHREIGYWIGKEHWGKGIATEAVARFLDLVTDRPLYAWVAEHNIGSIRVLEKCGFTFSGDQPQPQADEVRHVVMELRA